MNANRAASTLANKPAGGERHEPPVDRVHGGSGGDEIWQKLLDPSVYPRVTTHVELIETHISWVFLTDQFAYKLKKPVRFEFLDFSTAQRRRQACEREVTLNRRLARDVYLEVVSVVIDRRGQVKLNGPGQAVDWLVKMKRLPAAQALDRLIQEGQFDPRDRDQLAATLARFYTRLPPVTVRTDRYCQQFEQHVRANTEELSKSSYGFDQELVQRIHGDQIRFLHLSQELLINRVRDGRIVDGHGDLRPEHVYLTPDPVIIDCIEFNDEFRILDVADELAFLAMECEKLGDDSIGQRIFHRYRELSGDEPPSALVDFFKCYRACVRAKVNALRARQKDEGQKDEGRQTPEFAEARRYLALADTYGRRLGAPILLVVHGLSGTGKSTLAEALAQNWGAAWLQTDRIRQQIFGRPTNDCDFGQGRYSADNRQQVYDEMFRQAAQQLEQGTSVILDGTFLQRDQRLRALELASRTGAEVLLVQCWCSADVALERVYERSLTGSSPSEISPQQLAQQREQEEPNDPDWPSCRVDTTDGLPTVLSAIVAQLRSPK